MAKKYLMKASLPERNEMSGAVSFYLFCYKILPLVIQAVRILTIILIQQLQKFQLQQKQNLGEMGALH